MRSASKVFIVDQCGQTIEETVGLVRDEIAKRLNDEKAVDAEVLAKRMHSPALEEPAKFQLVVSVAYCTEVDLDDWLDAALDETVAGIGPGLLKLPKSERKK